jgi:hypothetical protein
VCRKSHFFNTFVQISFHIHNHERLSILVSTSRYAWFCIIQAEPLLHELAGHVQKAANTTGRATRSTSTATSLHVHLERHLCCRTDNILLGRAAGSVSVGALLVCTSVRYMMHLSSIDARSKTYRRASRPRPLPFRLAGSGRSYQSCFRRTSSWPA